MRTLLRRRKQRIPKQLENRNDLADQSRRYLPHRFRPLRTYLELRHADTSFLLVAGIGNSCSTSLEPAASVEPVPKERRCGTGTGKSGIEERSLVREAGDCGSKRSAEVAMTWLKYLYRRRRVGLRRAYREWHRGFSS